MKNIKASTIVAIVLLLGGITFATCRIIGKIKVRTEYENLIGSQWEMADRVSTIKQKSDYIDKYYTTLKNQRLEGLNQNLYFIAPQGSFDENIKALESLQMRLKEVSQMDESSLAYQQAISQITEQEQGQGLNMTEVFYDCWLQKNHYMYWNTAWIVIFAMIQIISIIVGALILMDPYT